MRAAARGREHLLRIALVRELLFCMHAALNEPESNYLLCFDAAAVQSLDGLTFAASARKDTSESTAFTL